MNIIKGIKTIILLIALISPIGLLAQSFEGVLEMSTMSKTSGENAKVKWYISQGRHKMVVSSASEKGAMQYAMLFDGGGDAKMLVQSSQGNIVTTIPMGKLSGKGSIKSNAHYIKGNEEKNIAGFKCFSVKDDKGQTVAWVSEQTGIAVNDLPQLMQNEGALKILEANGINGIPLELIGNNDKGELVFHQLVLSIQPGKVSDSEFDYSGYKKAEDLTKELNSQNKK